MDPGRPIALPRLRPRPLPFQVDVVGSVHLVLLVAGLRFHSALLDRIPSRRCSFLGDGVEDLRRLLCQFPVAQSVATDGQSLTKGSSRCERLGTLERVERVRLLQEHDQIRQRISVPPQSGPTSEEERRHGQGRDGEERVQRNEQPRDRLDRDPSPQRPICTVDQPHLEGRGLQGNGEDCEPEDDHANSDQRLAGSKVGQVREERRLLAQVQQRSLRPRLYASGCQQDEWHEPRQGRLDAEHVQHDDSR